MIKFSSISFLILIQLIFSSIVFSQDSLFVKSDQEIWVDSVMDRLSLDEKIGQLFMVAAYSNKDQNHIDEIEFLIKKYNIGGLIFFQGGPIHQAMLTNQYQSLSEIPLFIAIDGEWGLGMRLDSTISYPRQMMLGAVQNENLLYQMGVDIGNQMKRLGIHINFAPVVDVNNNANNPVINVRSFGEKPEWVSQKGIAYMKGMQDAGIIATAKHFPGHGDTDSDSHYTLPPVNHERNRLDSVELYPFQKIFDAGIEGVMIAHLNVPALGTQKDTPTTLTKSVVTDLLQNEMGFKGLIFTDALNMKGATKYYEPGEIECMALEAGNDVLLYPVSVSKAIAKIKKQVRRGEISRERIDASCRKILAAKYSAGLNQLDRSKPVVKIEKLEKDLNQLVYHVTRMDLINSSLTLIKNENDFLPVKKLKRVRFASLAFNTNEITEFQNTLSKYTKIDHFVFSEDKADSLYNVLKDYDVVFASVHNTSYWPSDNYKVKEHHLDFAGKLASETELVLTQNLKLDRELN